MQLCLICLFPEDIFLPRLGVRYIVKICDYYQSFFTISAQQQTYADVHMDYSIYFIVSMQYFSMLLHDILLWNNFFTWPCFLLSSYFDHFNIFKFLYFYFTLPAAFKKVRIIFCRSFLYFTLIVWLVYKKIQQDATKYLKKKAFLVNVLCFIS